MVIERIHAFDASVETRSALGRDVGRDALENDRLAFEIRHQTLGAALSADAGLLETTKSDAEIGTVYVVPDRSRAQLTGDPVGPIRVRRPDRSRPKLFI